MKYKSLASIRIKVILDKKGLKNVDIVRRIRNNSTDRLRRICNIDLKRLEEILDGDKVTFLEASLIMQAINEDISRAFGVWLI